MTRNNGPAFSATSGTGCAFVEDAWVYGDCHSHNRARHRPEHGNVQHHQCDAYPAASLCRSRPHCHDLECMAPERVPPDAILLSANLTGSGDPERLDGARASASSSPFWACSLCLVEPSTPPRTRPVRTGSSCSVMAYGSAVSPATGPLSAAIWCWMARITRLLASCRASSGSASG